MTDDSLYSRLGIVLRTLEENAKAIEFACEKLADMLSASSVPPPSDLESLTLPSGALMGMHELPVGSSEAGADWDRRSRQEPDSAGDHPREQGDRRELRRNRESLEKATQAPPKRRKKRQARVRRGR